MTAELMRSYSGVPCLWCREPIAFFGSVARLQVDLDSEETTAQAFIARCKLRDCENIYSITDIRTYDGVPRRRIAKSRASRIKRIISVWSKVNR
jgi:hypothetical protein